MGASSNHGGQVQLDCRLPPGQVASRVLFLTLILMIDVGIIIIIKQVKLLTNIQTSVGMPIRIHLVIYCK